MVHPFIEKARAHFSVVNCVSVELPRYATYLNLLKSIRLGKLKTFRRWRWLCEKTPQSFDLLTRRAETVLAVHQNSFDFVIQFGGLNAPGLKARRYMIVSDSVRYLSHKNKSDPQSVFDSADMADRWFSRERKVYQGAMKVLVGSQIARNALIEFYGVDPQKIGVFRPTVTTEYELAPKNKIYDGKTILFVGKGDFEKKGGRDLLLAFAKIRQIIPDAVLHIVGQQGDFGPGVIAYGELRDKATMCALYQKAHVFILPSHIDRFGMSLVEAMSASTPCIAANYQAQPEIVGHTGAIVEPGDVEAIAYNALRFLSDINLSQRCGSAAHQRYLEEFSAAANEKIMVNAIRDALLV